MHKTNENDAIKTSKRQRSTKRLETHHTHAIQSLQTQDANIGLKASPGTSLTCSQTRNSSQDQLQSQIQIRKQSETSQNIILIQQIRYQQSRSQQHSTNWAGACFTVAKYFISPIRFSARTEGKSRSNTVLGGAYLHEST